MRGKVKFYNARKKFGFIHAEDGNFYYFHVSQLEEKVLEGDSVIFTPTENARGLEAKDIKLFNQK